MRKEAGERRGLAVEVVSLASAFIVLIACAFTGFEQTALLSLVVVTASLGVFFAGFERGSVRLRDTMPAVVLAALAAAGRILFAPIPSFKPVTAVTIIAGAVFGRRTGFMVGALAGLASNFFFGQGPWTPWQMYAWGMMGYCAGLFGKTRVFDSVPAVCVYGFVSALGYGLIINVWSIAAFYHPQDMVQLLAVYAAALPFDIAHGVSTMVFLLALYAPWKRKLLRMRAKYDLSSQ